MEKQPFLLPFSSGTRLAALILILILSLLFSLLLGVVVAYPFWGAAVLKAGLSENLTDPMVITMLKYFQIVSQFGFFIFPAILFSYLSTGSYHAYLNVNRRPLVISMILAVSAILASMPLINWMIEVNQLVHLPDFLAGMEQWMKQSEDSASALTKAFLGTPSIRGFCVNILMIAVLPALGEELLFRGILVRLFREWTKSAHIAVILAAFLFSAIHLQFYGFFPRFMLGILLGYLFIWSGNLWLPVLVHFVNNFITVLASFLFQRGLISTDPESATNQSSFGMVLISAVVTFLLLWILYSREKQQAFKLRQVDPPDLLQ